MPRLVTVTLDELETLAGRSENSADQAVQRAASAVRAAREALNLALRSFEDAIADSVGRVRVGHEDSAPFAFDFDSEALDSWWDGPHGRADVHRPRLRLVRRPRRVDEAD